MPAHTDFYSIPAAYDVLHAPGTAGDVRALERIELTFVEPGRPQRRNAQRRNPGGASRPSAGPWLEPACGTARYLIAAAKRGRVCWGFDLEPRMIAFARARARELGRRVRLFEADMRSFDAGRRLPKFSLAFNLINTIRHLDSDAAMLDHLAAVARVLRPGGVYAVGLSLAAYGLEPPTEDVWTGSRGRCTVTQVVQYIPPTGKHGGGRVERVHSHLTIRRGEREEHIDSTYRLRSYNGAQWHRLIAASAMEIVGTVDQDGRPVTACEPGYAVYVLRARA